MQKSLNSVSCEHGSASTLAHAHMKSTEFWHMQAWTSNIFKTPLPAWNLVWQDNSSSFKHSSVNDQLWKVFVQKFVLFFLCSLNLSNGLSVERAEAQNCLSQVSYVWRYLLPKPMMWRMLDAVPINHFMLGILDAKLVHGIQINCSIVHLSLNRFRDSLHG